MLRTVHVAASSLFVKLASVHRPSTLFNNATYWYLIKESQQGMPPEVEPGPVKNNNVLPRLEGSFLRNTEI